MRIPVPGGKAPYWPMTSTLNFDEKKFWIVLFSIVARREAMREQVIERADEPQKQQERREWRMRTGRRERPLS
jgi:hypothetical protein